MNLDFSLMCLCIVLLVGKVFLEFDDDLILPVASVQKFTLNCSMLFMHRVQFGYFCESFGQLLLHLFKLGVNFKLEKVVMFILSDEWVVKRIAELLGVTLNRSIVHL